MNAPPLPPGHKANFKTLQQAFEAGDICLLSAIRIADQKPVALICALNHEGDDFMPVPLAELVNGNPYELYEPPFPR